MLQRAQSLIRNRITRSFMFQHPLIKFFYEWVLKHETSHYSISNYARCIIYHIDSRAILKMMHLGG